MCINWKIKCFILLMHGATMKFIIQLYLIAFKSYIATNKSNLSLRNVHINWSALNSFSRRMKGTGHVARMGD